MDRRREDLRVADVDRAFVAERLRAAIDEGRLSLAEYDERVRDAYAARTYADLDRLLMDLPGIAVPQHQGEAASLAQPSAPPATSLQPEAALGGAEVVRSRLPVARWLVAIWGVWFFAVSINVVVWLLVSLSSESGPVYFWPMWVAGPWGVVLAAVTVSGLLAGAPHGTAGSVESRAARRMARLQRRQARRQARFGARL